MLAGCVTSGTVTGKSYDDAYVSCVSQGSAQRCTDYDECWRLDLRNARGNRMSREGDVCVPHEVWESTEVGEFYDGPTVRR